MDSNLTQNHLSLAQPSGKKTQQRVTMYSKRDQNTLLSRLFWILKVTWDVLINGSEGKLGKVGSGSQKHLICCRITWLCVIPRLHHTVRNEGVWTGRTQAVICTGPEEQCSWFLLLREVRLEEWDQMGCLPKRSKNTGSRPWRPCRSAVLNPRDSSGHGGKKNHNLEISSLSFLLPKDWLRCLNPYLWVERMGWGVRACDPSHQGGWGRRVLAAAVWGPTWRVLETFRRKQYKASFAF